MDQGCQLYILIICAVKEAFTDDFIYYWLDQRLRSRSCCFFVFCQDLGNLKVIQTAMNLKLRCKFSSVAQSCLTLCNPMDCSMRGLPIHHQFLEFTQTYVRWVSDDIQPFCRPLLLPPSIFPSIRVFSNESVLRIRWPKYSHFSFSISPSNEYSGLIFFRIDWFDLLAVQGTLKSLLNTTVQKHHFFGTQLSLWSNSHTHTWPLEKP